MGEAAVEVEWKAAVESGWHQGLRAGILAIADELRVPASRREVQVHFPCVRRGIGRVGIEWYNGTKRYAFRIEWPAHRRPAIEYVRALARLKIEHMLAVMRGEAEPWT